MIMQEVMVRVTNCAKIDLFEQLVSQYVRVFHPQTEVNFTVVFVSKDEWVDVSGTNSALITQVQTFAERMLFKVNASHWFGDGATVQGVIGLPITMNSTTFYDTWYQQVVRAYPDITIGAIAFVPIDRVDVVYPVCALKITWDEQKHQTVMANTMLFDAEQFCERVAVSIYNGM
jgi:hypothetical protein